MNDYLRDQIDETMKEYSKKRRRIMFCIVVFFVFTIVIGSAILFRFSNIPPIVIQP